MILAAITPGTKLIYIFGKLYFPLSKAYKLIVTLFLCFLFYVESQFLHTLQIMFNSNLVISMKIMKLPCSLAT